MIGTTLYLHSSKDDNREVSRELGLSDTAADQFAYAAYEVSIRVQVDPETGVAMATHFNGVELERPVEV